MAVRAAGSDSGTRPETAPRLGLVVVSVLFAAAFALGLEPFLRAVTVLGRNIPPHDLAADYIAAALWAFVLALGILAWPVRAGDRIPLLAAWVVKVVVTLVLMLPYEWNYDQLDAYTYFGASQQPRAEWELVGLGQGTENINALAWLHGQLIPGSYHALKVTYAMFGLLAIYVFYRAAVAAIDREAPRLFYMLALFPSILFWSSILGKDPLILLGIAIYCYGVVRWQREQRTVYLLWSGVGVLVAVWVRLWLGPILAGPLVLLAILGTRGVGRRLMWSTVSIAATAVALRAFWDKFAIETVGDLLATTNQWSQGWAEGGSAQTLTGEFTGVGSMVKFLPKGMFTALFRPLPGEVMNPFGLLAGLENGVLLGLLVTAIVRTRREDLREPLVLWAGSLVLGWAAIYGFISYQNLGTAVRFRLQVLPILLLLLLYLARRRGATAGGGSGAAVAA